MDTSYTVRSIATYRVRNFSAGGGNRMIDLDDVLQLPVKQVPIDALLPASSPRRQQGIHHARDECSTGHLAQLDAHAVVPRSAGLVRIPARPCE
jgi:hypothetical protein